MIWSSAEHFFFRQLGGRGSKRGYFELFGAFLLCFNMMLDLFRKLLRYMRCLQVLPFVFQDFIVNLVPPIILNIRERRIKRNFWIHENWKTPLSLPEVKINAWDCYLDEAASLSCIQPNKPLVVEMKVVIWGACNTWCWWSRPGLGPLICLDCSFFLDAHGPSIFPSTWNPFELCCSFFFTLAKTHVHHVRDK